MYIQTKVQSARIKAKTFRHATAHGLRSPKSPSQREKPYFSIGHTKLRTNFKFY